MAYRYTEFESQVDSRMPRRSSKPATGRYRETARTTQGYGETAPMTADFQTAATTVTDDTRGATVKGGATSQVTGYNDHSDSATPPDIRFEYCTAEEAITGKKVRRKSKKGEKERRRSSTTVGSEMLPDDLRPSKEVGLYDHLITKKFGPVFAMRVIVMLLIIPAVSLIILGGRTWLAKFNHVYGLSGQTCILLLQLLILAGTVTFIALWIMKVNIHGNEFLLIHRKSSILFDLAAGCQCFMMFALEAYYSSGNYYVAAQPRAVIAGEVDAVFTDGRVHPQMAITWVIAAILLFLQGCVHVVLTVLVVKGWFY